MSTQKERFAGAVVVVTGAASGIGRATALRFARAGAVVHVADLDEAGARRVAGEVDAGGGRGVPHAVDVADAASVAALAEAVFADRERRVDVLHNNAGIAHAGDVDDTELEDWQRVLGVNLMGVVHGVHAFVPRMLAQGRPAHVVNTASVLGLVAGARLAPYVTSKFGVVGLSLALNAELAPRGIRVTAICPGIIDTAIVGRATMRGEMVERAAAAQRFYAKRGSSPDVVAEAVLDAVARKQLVRTVPRSQVAPAWALARVSARASQGLARAMPRIMTSG